MTSPTCGEKADITIKNARIVSHPSARLVRIADKNGDTFDMPPQAAITHASDQAADDDALHERISNALRAIDNMVDEQMLDPWPALAIRKQLDPNPRHWPPQAGDVWDDGRPFGFIAPLWFAQVIHETKRSHLVMVSMESGTVTSDRKTPEELLAEPNELRLVYRHKDGGQ